MSSIVKTRDQVADHFGVHVRTVAGWLAAGCPGKRGAYDLERIAAWRNRPQPAAAREPSPSAAAIAELTAAVNRLAAAIGRAGSK
jgi:hypothetical protein